MIGDLIMGGIIFFNIYVLWDVLISPYFGY